MLAEATGAAAGAAAAPSGLKKRRKISGDFKKAAGVAKKGGGAAAAPSREVDSPRSPARRNAPPAALVPSPLPSSAAQAAAAAAEAAPEVAGATAAEAYRAQLFVDAIYAHLAGPVNHSLPQERVVRLANRALTKAGLAPFGEAEGDALCREKVLIEMSMEAASDDD